MWYRSAVTAPELVPDPDILDQTNLFSPRSLRSEPFVYYSPRNQAVYLNADAVQKLRSLTYGDPSLTNLAPSFSQDGSVIPAATALALEEALLRNLDEYSPDAQNFLLQLIQATESYRKDKQWGGTTLITPSLHPSTRSLSLEDRRKLLNATLEETLAHEKLHEDVMMHGVEPVDQFSPDVRYQFFQRYPHIPQALEEKGYENYDDPDLLVAEGPAYMVTNNHDMLLPQKLNQTLDYYYHSNRAFFIDYVLRVIEFYGFAPTQNWFKSHLTDPFLLNTAKLIYKQWKKSNPSAPKAGELGWRTAPLF